MSKEPKKPTIVSHRSLKAYFRELVADASDRMGLELSEEVQFYVVNLLDEFASNHNVYGSEERLLDEPLALLYQRCLETHPPHRNRLLKQLGDVALFMSGYFSDSLCRKLVSTDYYVSIGTSAYRQLRDLSDRSRKSRLFADVYDELANGFETLVDVVGDVSESSPMGSDDAIVRLYERWSRTGSDRLLRRLRGEGIIPVDFAGSRTV